MFVTVHTSAMVSVALLICASFATPVCAQDEAEAMGLMHTNTKVEMAVASSGEIHAVADDKMELMSNKHLVLQNSYIEQMEASVLFKNVDGGRCLSSNVNSDSHVTFETCDTTSIAQMWSKRSDDSYESVAKLQAVPAQHLCPGQGPYVNCGRNSTILGPCPGFKLWYTGADLTFLNLQDQTFKNCLSWVSKEQDLVVSTPGSTHYCGRSGWGAAWQMIAASSTSTTVVDTASTTAALSIAAQAAADKAAADEAAAAKYEVLAGGDRCTLATAITEAECTEVAEWKSAVGGLKLTPSDQGEDKAPGCYHNEVQTKVFFNSHPTGQESASVSSICKIAA